MRGKTFGSILIGLILLMSLGYSNRAIAEVNIHVGVNVPPPPPLVIPAPPPMVVVPGTYVYFAPELEMDIFFYHGYWYRAYQGRWYRSGGYKGPWVYLVHEKVPVTLLRLPPDFRRVPSGHTRIPHGQLKKNWRTWEKEKYWNKHGGKEWHGNDKREHRKGKDKAK
ncbi:MAG: hypothetical protein A2V86_09040 [Deltaproteobacteria bacterium RBG_16_49_23]|nr:MAG: hypothetical protein A2V86_09040 [Deltaproteobacteria bacterium RBG_16_49_23]OGQ10063.1 MAG: hypothetical protein A2026_21540 [Deltaproteobacteria bacterium RBG_19FT_COMBO_46_12]